MIPKGTTEKYEHYMFMDLGFEKILLKDFRILFYYWKTIVLLENNTNLHQRNNIIKLQSSIYNQLSSTQYYNLFKYLWFKSRCTNERPEEFKSSIKFSFEGTSTIHDIVAIILL